MLKRIDLKNVCQHANLNIEVGPGLTVVVGPQGSGKSNLLTMALSSVTGENPLYGTKKDNVRRGCGKAASFVSTTWQGPDGKDYQVTRGFQRQKSSLTVDGEIQEGVRRETEITEALTTALQVDPKTLGTFSFVRQGETDALILEKPTNRTKFIADLLEQSWLLGFDAPVIAAIDLLTFELGRNYLEKLAQLILDRNSAGTAYREAQELRDHWRSMLATAKQAYEQYQETIFQLNQLSGMKEQLQNLTTKWEKAYRDAESLHKEIAVLEQRVVKGQEAVQVYEGCQAELQRRKDQARITRRLSSLQADVKGLRLQLVPPVEPEGPAGSQELVNDIHLEINKAKRRLSLLKSGKAECETCGKPIEAKAGELESLALQLEDANRRYNAAVERLNLTSAYQNAKAMFESKVEGYERSLSEKLAEGEELQAELAALPAEVGIPDWVANDSRGLQSYRDLLDQVRSEVAQKKSNLASETSSVHHYAEQHASLAGQIAKLDLAQDNIEQAKEAKANYDEADQNYVSAVSAVAKSEAYWKSFKGSIAETTARVREQRKALQAKELLQELRPHLRPNELPRETLRHLLQGVAASMSELCYELGQPFEISIGEELEFVISHADGSQEPAQRLSGGQKACVATVFWLTRLVSGLGSSLPILVLDEPTANMDEHAVARFGELLQNLGPTLAKRGLQVFVVTHHQQLRSCGQQVIDLGDPSVTN